MIKAPDSATVVRATILGNIQFVNGIAENLTPEQEEMFLKVPGYKKIKVNESGEIIEEAKEEVRLPNTRNSLSEIHKFARKYKISLRGAKTKMEKLTIIYKVFGK